MNDATTVLGQALSVHVLCVKCGVYGIGHKCYNHVKVEVSSVWMSALCWMWLCWQSSISAFSLHLQMHP